MSIFVKKAKNKRKGKYIMSKHLYSNVYYEKEVEKDPEYMKDVEKGLSGDCKARERLLTAHLHRLEMHVRRTYRNGVTEDELEDIIQEATVRLWEALSDYYVNGKNVNYNAYVAKSIEYASKKAYRKTIGFLYASESTKRKADKVAAQMKEQNMSDAEIAKTIGCKESTVKSYRLLHESKKMTSLDKEDEDGNNLAQILSDDKMNVEEKAIANLSVQEESLFEGMSSEEKFVYKIYLQEEGKAGRTVSQCKKYGMTEKRVKDIIKKYKKM